MAGYLAALTGERRAGRAQLFVATPTGNPSDHGGSTKGTFDRGLYHRFPTAGRGSACGLAGGLMMVFHQDCRGLGSGQCTTGASPRSVAAVRARYVTVA